MNAVVPFCCCWKWLSRKANPPTKVLRTGSASLAPQKQQNQERSRFETLILSGKPNTLTIEKQRTVCCEDALARGTGGKWVKLGRR